MDPVTGPALAELAGVEWRPLRVIADDRGAVLHMVRADAPGFAGFGEVYFSELRPGVTKGWKLHLRMTQRLAIVQDRLTQQYNKLDSVVSSLQGSGSALLAQLNAMNASLQR